MTNIIGCRFCGYFSRDAVEDVDTPWLRDNNYCAIVSKGALVPGWSLLCPLKHGLSLKDDYKNETFWDFAGKAEAIIRARHGEVRVFEHGAGYEGSLTGCGTDHAHLHIVPLVFDLTTEVLRYDSTLNWVSCEARDVQEIVAEREYLFVADKFNGYRTAGLVCMPGQPVSQFFRRIVATRLGLREFYDYRRHPMLDIATSSALQLRADLATGERIASK